MLGTRTKKRLLLAGFVSGAVALAACSKEKLNGLGGALGTSVCDAASACGCDTLAAEDAIDFGTPTAGAATYRTLRLQNTRKPQALNIAGIDIADPTGIFILQSLEWRSSGSPDAQTRSHSFTNGPLQLTGNEEAWAYLRFAPTAPGEQTSTVKVLSDDDSHPELNFTLVGGGGTGTLCALNECATPAIDFGEHQDVQLSSSFGVDGALTLTNTGSRPFEFQAEVSDDAGGVFTLVDPGCARVAPGESLDIKVRYTPFGAGEHQGEALVRWLGRSTRIPLKGRVVGAHLCFTTQDDSPTDALLRFGDAPLFLTPSNGTETRMITVRNCGYATPLEISSVVLDAASDDAFSLPSIDLASLAPLAADGTSTWVLPVTLAPNGSASFSLQGRVFFGSNDFVRPLAAVDLNGGAGAPEQCVLVSGSDPVDFGWVAADDASQGCEVGTFGCPGIEGEVLLSRRRTFQLINVGARACTQISLGTIALSNPAGTFTIESNPNGANFTLAPNGTSLPIAIVFTTAPRDTAANFFGQLPFSSPDTPVSASIELRARAGGSPHCALDFAPVSPPSFLCTSESLNFGSVNIGQTKTIDLKVSNVGSEICNVTNVRRAASANAAFSVPPDPFAISPGNFVILPVTFAPTSPSSSDPFGGFVLNCALNSIQMTANTGTGGANENHTLGLSGYATAPDIDVIPGTIDFGEVTVGCCSADRRVAIYNSGDGTLGLTGSTVLSSSDPRFIVTQPGDLQLSPGESTEFLVKFCAQGVGDKTGVVQIQSTDANEQFFAVGVSGTGTLSNEGLDEFVQPARPQVDVLWVVDDSGSMAEEQDTLATNFSSFIATATSLNADYHIGVVNTDVESEWAGKLYSCSGPTFISDSLPVATQQSQFACNVRTSDSSRPHSDQKEASLQAARMALSYPNVDGFNAGFLRAAAKLYVIMVTDETDQSDGPANLYVDFFRDLKGAGNPELLNLSAISGPPPSGCATADANDKGFEAVAAVGGQFRSICTSDWSTMISALGLDVFNPRRQFPLSRPATASTLVVQVCDDDGAGNAVSCVNVAQSPTTGWTFDAALNAVTLHGTVGAAPNKHIRVSYDAICFGD